jgi:putative FmdB family regulatory protein
MPTYEFTCPNGHDFEKFFRTISSGQAELPCPICGAIAHRKISAGAGLMFKGSGFYITDYGKDGKKDQGASRKSSNGEGAAASGASDPSGGDAKSGGDSKPASESKASEQKASSDSKASSASSAPAKPAESKPSTPKGSKSSE